MVCFGYWSKAVKCKASGKMFSEFVAIGSKKYTVEYMAYHSISADRLSKGKAGAFRYE